MLRRLVVRTAALIWALVICVPAWAATYYVAPQGATIRGTPNGSVERPFPSVDAALRSNRVKGGDVVVLKNGSHGDLILYGVAFTKKITIRSQSGKGAHVNSISVGNGSRNIKFLNLTVWKPDNEIGALVFTDDRSSDLIFEGLIVQSRRNISDRLSWSAAQWVSRMREGMLLFSARTEVIHCKVRVVSLGIASIGPNSKVVASSVIDFAGDGMRAGSNNVIAGNYIANSFRVDGNHNDGFQSWAGASGSVTNLRLARNRIYEWTHGAHPLRSSLQGIGLFDGWYDNLVITNNVVSVSAHHGIAVYGTRGATITHNTVVASNNQPGAYPWIMVTNHKNGSPSRNVVVANNLAMKFMTEPAAQNDANNVVFTRNAVITNPARVFENAARFDFRPKAGSGFIDRGVARHGSAVDLKGNKRPFKKGYDLGAYEIGSSLARTTTAAAPEETDIAEEADGDSTLVTPDAPETHVSPEAIDDGAVDVADGTDGATGDAGTDAADGSTAGADGDVATAEGDATAEAPGAKFVTAP